MAIIAAGNKIIGKPQDILKIVEHDEDQLWVLVNHIYDRKICFTNLYTSNIKRIGELKQVFKFLGRTFNDIKGDNLVQNVVHNTVQI